MFMSFTNDPLVSPSPSAQTEILKIDPAVDAVLRECRHRTLTVASILCRKLNEDIDAIEAAQEAENGGRQGQSGDNSNNCNSAGERAEERDDSQLYASDDDTDPDKVQSLFTPTVEPESDSVASQTDCSAAPTQNAFECSLGHIANNWSRNHIGIHTFASATGTGKMEKSERLFPNPSGRWECGTFLGKRVFIERNNSFLGRGSMAVVLGGNIVVTETVNGEEKRLVSVPVAIKEVVCDAKQKSIRTMIEVALRFRLEVDHPGFVRVFHAGGYYPPFSRLVAGKVPIYSHIALACSTIGSIADVLKRRGPFSMQEIQRCMAEMLTTLQFLHEDHHWVHNDIKSHNILIFNSASELSNYKYQLTDFTALARARTVEEVVRDIQNGLSEQFTHTTVGGTAAFMSPESCLGLGMLTSNDIWSLGITAYHMGTNTLPWKPLEHQFPSMILNGYRCKFSLDTIFGRPIAEWKGPSTTSPAMASDHSLHSTGEGRKEFSGRDKLKNSSMSSGSVGSTALRETYADFGPILDELDHSAFPKDYQDFVKQCLIENPVERPTARQLREHPFVNIHAGDSRASVPASLSI